MPEIEKYVPVGADEALGTEMGQRLQESEIQMDSGEQPLQDGQAEQFQVEQLELDRKLDQIQPFVNMLDRPRDGYDNDQVFAKVEDNAKAFLPEWKKVYDRLPLPLKEGVDGRDLALKIQIIEKCLKETADIEAAKQQIAQM